MIFYKTTSQSQDADDFVILTSDLEIKEDLSKALYDPNMKLYILHKDVY